MRSTALISLAFLTATVFAACGFDIHSDDAVKKAWYFPGDISDDGWSQRPGLAAFVGAQGEVVTFLKAASYLMFRNSFDDVRNTVLTRSRAVVEDASGVPYHYFANDDWDVKLFGAYTKPIPLFEVRCQPDLAKASAAGSAGELPFSFGYTHWKGHMLYATKVGDVGGTSFDANSNVGESTYCNAGRLIVEGRAQ